jgi:uncharacterized membrane protein
MILSILFVLFPIVGLADTIYLINKRKKGKTPVCPLKGDCAFMLNSKYNKILGVHTDVIGLAYYVGIILWILTIVALVILADNEIGLFSTNLEINLSIAAVLFLTPILATLAAFLMTLRMLFLQLFVIKKMCFWCLLSSICILGMTACLVLMVAIGSSM